MRFIKSKCMICGADSPVFLGHRQHPSGNKELEVRVVKCSLCGFLYADPMPELEVREIQSNYDQPDSYFAKDTESRIGLFEKALGEVEAFLPSKGRLLDVGCGRGELLHSAGKRGWDAVGSDISDTFVKYAIDKYKVNAMVGDLNSLDFKDGSFDAVFLVSVIQYLQDPMANLRKIYRLLRPGGILYIEVTNDDALVFRAGDIFLSIKGGKRLTTRLSPLFPSYQMFGLTKKSLLTALRSAGFEVKNVRTSGFTGGGRVPGRGPLNILLNICRKAVIFVGGVTGNGHLLFCAAKKG